MGTISEGALPEKLAVAEEPERAIDRRSTDVRQTPSRHRVEFIGRKSTGRRHGCFDDSPTYASLTDKQLKLLQHGNDLVSVAFFVTAFADTGVLSPIAFPTYFCVVVDAKILRLCISSAADLEDNAITFAIGQCGLGNEGITGFVEFELRLSGRSLGNCGDGLFGGRERLHVLAVESDADFLVGLDEEFGMAAIDFNNFSAFRTGNNFIMTVALLGECGGSQEKQSERGCE
jgi:hypothetical protein